MVRGTRCSNDLESLVVGVGGILVFLVGVAVLVIVDHTGKRMRQWASYQVRRDYSMKDEDIPQLIVERIFNTEVKE